jgi:hypothetical protein
MANSKRRCGAMSKSDGDTAEVTCVHVCTTHTHAYTHACMHVRFRVGTSGANNASARRSQFCVPLRRVLHQTSVGGGSIMRLAGLGWAGWAWKSGLSGKVYES